MKHALPSGNTGYFKCAIDITLRIAAAIAQVERRWFVDAECKGGPFFKSSLLPPHRIERAIGYYGVIDPKLRDCIISAQLIHAGDRRLFIRIIPKIDQLEPEQQKQEYENGGRLQTTTNELLPLL